MEEKTIDKLCRVSLSLFRQNIFGVFHGSISARVELSKFIVNKKEAIFDAMDEEDFTLLRHTRDYRWKEASLDSEIHSSIYQNIPNAKFVAYAMPPFTTAYSLENDYVSPRDYFGKRLYPSLQIYDPKDADDWYERADVEIPRAMIERGSDILIIRGYGVYAHAREINDLAKKIAIVENSCKILTHASFKAF
ncbi:MAG: class II aldolase and adducin N-terminal domain-containing protein [Helicobacteraceae bacterium]|jgi:L-fuculose-phosphate aldolase|nr:class II aldolase and adducin N-terminal domain-containing protein [Helicobacteraceae bacterium]